MFIGFIGCIGAMGYSVRGLGQQRDSEALRPGVPGVSMQQAGLQGGLGVWGAYGALRTLNPKP